MINLNTRFKNFGEKFNFFYKYRFNNDYLKFSLNKKKFSKKKSKIWFKEKDKELKIYKIIFCKKIIGMIYYNTENFFYSIIINRNNRGKKLAINALKIFFSKMKKKNLKVYTMVNIKNDKSIYIHDTIFQAKKIKKKKNFIYYKVI